VRRDKEPLRTRPNSQTYRRQNRKNKSNRRRSGEWEPPRGVVTPLSKLQNPDPLPRRPHIGRNHSKRTTIGPYLSSKLLPQKPPCYNCRPRLGRRSRGPSSAIGSIQGSSLRRKTEHQSTAHEYSTRSQIQHTLTNTAQARDSGQKRTNTAEAYKSSRSSKQRAQAHEYSGSSGQRAEARDSKQEHRNAERATQYKKTNSSRPSIISYPRIAVEASWILCGGTRNRSERVQTAKHTDVKIEKTHQTGGVRGSGSLPEGS